MPGAMLPPALGQVQPNQAPQYFPDDRPEQGPAPVIPPTPTSVSQAQSQLDAAEARYRTLASLDTDAEIHRRMNAGPDPYGNHAKGFYTPEEQRAATQALSADRTQARNAVSDAQKSLAAATKAEGQSGGVPRYPMQVTNPQTGETTTVMVTGETLAERERQGQTSQQADARLAETHAHNDVTEKMQQAGLELRAMQMKIAKEYQDDQARGKSIDQAQAEAKLKLAAAGQWWDDWSQWANRQVVAPYRQMQQTASHEFATRMADAAAQDTSNDRIFGAQDSAAVSQRNNNMNNARQVLTKVLDLYQDSLKHFLTPEQAQQALSKVNRYVTAKGMGHSTGGNVAAGSQDQGAGPSFGGQGPSADWQMPDQGAQDLTRFGLQPMRIPKDPMGYAIDQARQWNDFANEPGNWIGPRQPQPSPITARPQMPDFVYQLPPDPTGPPSAPNDILPASVIAGAQQYNQYRTNGQAPDTYDYNGGYPQYPPSLYTDSSPLMDPSFLDDGEQQDGGS